MSARDHALAYARLGWRVFVVRPGEKAPMYRGWQRDATTDPTLIARWWRLADPPNLGIVAGEAFTAWDIEGKHLASLGSWLRAAGARLPVTPIARTPRGGIHVYTLPVADLGNTNLYLDGRHIGETRGVGGLVVAPPSRTEHGDYRWHRDPAVTPLAPAPDWLLRLLTRPEAPPRRHRVTRPTDDPVRALDALAGAVLDAGEGRRNAMLYWSMRRALEEGIPARIAASALARAGTAAGLGEREVRATIRSAYQGGHA